MNISFTVFCNFVRLRISPARIKLAASNFARWFVGALGGVSPNWGNLALPEAQNRTNRRAAASIADRRESPPLTARSPSLEGTGVYRHSAVLALYMCGYTAISEADVLVLVVRHNLFMSSRN